MRQRSPVLLDELIAHFQREVERADRDQLLRQQVALREFRSSPLTQGYEHILPVAMSEIEFRFHVDRYPPDWLRRIWLRLREYFEGRDAVDRVWLVGSRRRSARCVTLIGARGATGHWQFESTVESSD